MKYSNILYIIIILTISTISNTCENKKQNQKTKIYSVKYFEKRRWCPTTQNFLYLKPIKNTNEELMNKYYKIYYHNNKLIKEEVYKDMDTPHSSWFYYNENNKIIKEEVYNNGKKIEEFIYSFDKDGYKTQDTNYVWTPNKKLRVKSIYLYNSYKNKKLLAKIQHFNTGILDEYIELEYDHKNRLRKKSVFFYTSQLKSYNLYSYNKYNLIKKEEIYTRDNKLIQVIKYKYKLNKNTNSPIKYTEKEKMSYRINKQNKLLANSKIYYYYNNAGNKIKQIEKAITNHNRKMNKIYEIQYSYDKNNCRKQEKRFDSKGDLIETINH